MATRRAFSAIYENFSKERDRKKKDKARSPASFWSVDGDDLNHPAADAIRGTLDGHIVLDRAIADQGRCPAVNVLTSISRLAQKAWTHEQSSLVAKLHAFIARYEDTRDLRLMGGYRQGADAELDQAVALVPKIYEAIAQSPRSSLSKDVFRDLQNSCSPSEPSRSRAPLPVAQSYPKWST